MFERFTDKAKTAVIVARAEASERSDQIRPVYLLHALAAGESVAARALAGLGVDAGVMREQAREDRGPAGRAKRVSTKAVYEQSAGCCQAIDVRSRKGTTTRKRLTKITQ